MAKDKTSTMEEALAKAVADFEDTTGEVQHTENVAISARIKRLLARKKTLQRQSKNHLPNSLK